VASSTTWSVRSTRPERAGGEPRWSAPARQGGGVERTPRRRPVEDPGHLGIDQALDVHVRGTLPIGTTGRRAQPDDGDRHGVSVPTMALIEAPGPHSPVIVTGGGSGIGRAAAVALAEWGRPVSLWGRDQGRLESAADECRAHGVDTHVLSIDLRDTDAIERGVAASVEALGGIAGRGPLGRRHAQPPACRSS